MSTSETTVYVIRCTTTGLVKIGRSVDPTRRLLGMQVGCPTRLEMLATWSATIWHETQLHSRFAGFRQHGEWFDLPAGALADLLSWEPGPAPIIEPPKPRRAPSSYLVPLTLVPATVQR